MENTAIIEILKSGIVKGGQTCSIDDVDNKVSEIVSLKRITITWQRYIACEKYGHCRFSRYSFVIVRGNVNDMEVYWVCQLRVLFRMKVNGCLKEMAFVNSMQLTHKVDETEEIHGCINLRWSTDDEIDRTHSRMEEHSTPSPWFGLVEVTNIVSVVQVIRQYYSVKDFKAKQHWSKHRFCVNRFANVGSNMSVEDTA